jgi:hypothetical protein
MRHVRVRRCLLAIEFLILLMNGSATDKAPSYASMRPISRAASAYALRVFIRSKWRSRSMLIKRLLWLSSSQLRALPSYSACRREKVGSRSRKWPSLLTQRPTTSPSWRTMISSATKTRPEASQASTAPAGFADQSANLFRENIELDFVANHFFLLVLGLQRAATPGLRRERG